MTEIIYSYASAKQVSPLRAAYLKAQPWVWGAGIIAGLYLVAFVALGGLVLFTV
jgi:hypothetical protein